MPRIVVIAGEASGDRLGASAIAALMRRRPDIIVEGIAGPAMRAAGCQPWFDARSLAVMGLAEVIGHLPRIWKIKRAVERRLRDDPPDALLGIDAPDFNLRVERTARRAGIPTIHYVCPSVWAWRESRVKTIRAACDSVLCLLPFEADFLARHGIDGRFVGHPLADELSGAASSATARTALGLAVNGEVVAVLPGSRDGEVQRIGPAFADTAAWLNARRPGIRFAVPAVTPALRESIEQQFRAHAPGCEVLIVDGRAHEVLAAADVALLASGTVTLEAMLLRRPMVVAYKLAPLTYRLARWLKLIRVDYMSLPNLLAERRLVPEFIQHDVHAERLGPALTTLLDAPDDNAELFGEFDSLHHQLRRSAGERAADAVLSVAGLAGAPGAN